MKIEKNALVNRNGAYYASGGLIVGSQRIPYNHKNVYWQQANLDLKLAEIFVDDANIVEIDEAIYIGRIPAHFGHFLMEGLPRLCDIVNIDKPIIGYITNGILPSGIKAMPQNEIRWIIQSATNEKFYEISENERYVVKKLYVPNLPYTISHNCAEPWRMTPLIQKIVSAAKNENPNIGIIEKLHLCRYEDMELGKFDESFTLSNPNESLSTQIAKVSISKALYGKIGSNTHISIFAKWNTLTNWIPRGNYDESDRNQLICDLVKTYNQF